jgi:hypothetical protein
MWDLTWCVSANPIKTWFEFVIFFLNDVILTFFKKKNKSWNDNDWVGRVQPNLIHVTCNPSLRLSYKPAGHKLSRV